MNNSKENVQRLIDSNLSREKQAWLLGAGISKEAGVPLMATLTEKIKKKLNDISYEGEDADLGALFDTIYGSLNDNSNIEDVLSQIGDFLTIAKRNSSNTVTIDSEAYEINTLKALHNKIQYLIREIVRYGYLEVEDEERKESKIEINDHLKFIEAIFGKVFSGKILREPIKFFTTNYDTLLEDALSLKGIKSVDGFWGGGLGFWDIKKFEEFRKDVSAEVYKLHGSIDWYTIKNEGVIRKREGANYPEEKTSQLLIYPQATKYRLTQRDPFAQLFEKFRRTLSSGELKLLGICGYSFNDEHINEEIEKAMSQVNDSITVLAFVKEKNEELPTVIKKWLSSGEYKWKENLLVATDKGFYHGSIENKLEGEEFNWWTFQGLIKVISQGAEVVL